MSPLLEARGLTTVFETRAGLLPAVRDVSFTVAAGEIVGLVGESGSGKSVTGFSLLGLIDPPGRIAAGSVRLDGEELIGLEQGRLRALRGRSIAMVFQDPSTTLNPLLTIGAQMRLALEAHGGRDASAMRARAIETLSQVGIADPAARLGAYPHQFSGGMRQRVAIAIALLNRPKLIVCDEPTTALDVSIQAQILSEMRDLARNIGTAMIWISHDLAVVSSIASRILVMYAGRVLETGPTRDVLSAPRHPYTQGLLDSLPAHATPGTALRQIPGSTPSLVDIGPGCAFAPRCARASEACASDPAESVAGNRRWRCHHPIAAVA
ncbi:MAG: ABC transporter ATP-binding protein [Methylobacteriaceae bacterium]|nr:ABC transporter ATP-binding protein [Methylobacteriaceae bacterium]